VKKIAVVGCGAYMDSGYGCPGEWRCLKAAAQGKELLVSRLGDVKRIKAQMSRTTWLDGYED
jgi:hypothetical protein